MEFLQKGVDALLDWIYPPVCLICGELLPLEQESRDVCVSCKADIPFMKQPTCKTCGGWIGQEETCKRCSKRRYAFKRGVGAFLYSDMKFAIHHMKFLGGKKDAKILGRWMTEYINQRFPAFWQSVDMLVPVPSDKRRQRNRGFNQAALLAEEIAILTGVPCVIGHLLRIRQTLPQNQLNEAQRLENCRDAFGTKNPEVFHGKVIVLIDDVFTTGATANACAQTLLTVGAKEVIPYCLAVTHQAEYHWDGQ